MRTASLALGSWLWVGILVPGCTRMGAGRPGAEALPAVVRLDYSQKEAVVQEQFRSAYEALDRDGDSAEVNGHLGMLCQAYDEPRAARVFYERAVVLAPDVFRWQFYLGVVCKALGEQERAIRILESAATHESNYLPLWTHLGELHLGRQELEQAERAYQRALEIVPESALAHYGLGRVAAARKDYEAAAGHLERSLSFTDAQENHYALAIAYRQLNRMDEAAIHMLRFQQVKIRLVAAPDPLRVAVDRLKRGGRYDLFRGDQMINARQYDVATRYFEDVVRDQPGLAPLAHQRLARVKSLQEDWAGVAEHCAVVLESLPSEETILNLYGVALLRLGRAEEALPVLRRALDVSSAPITTRANLAKALVELGRYPEAIEEYREALESDPGFHGVRRALARALSAGGDHALAVQSWDEYVKAVPGDAMAWAEYAADLRHVGEYTRAEQAARRARRLAPDDPAVGERLEAMTATQPAKKGGARN